MLWAQLGLLDPVFFSKTIHSCQYVRCILTPFLECQFDTREPILSFSRSMHSLIQQTILCVFMYRSFTACFTTLGYSDTEKKITKEKPAEIINLANGSKIFVWEWLNSLEHNNRLGLCWDLDLYFDDDDDDDDNNNNNHLTPNNHFSCHTAPLTSRCCNFFYLFNKYMYWIF